MCCVAARLDIRTLSQLDRRDVELLMDLDERLRPGGLESEDEPVGRRSTRVSIRLVLHTLIVDNVCGEIGVYRRGNMFHLWTYYGQLSASTANIYSGIL